MGPYILFWCLLCNVRKNVEMMIRLQLGIVFNLKMTVVSLLNQNRTKWWRRSSSKAALFLAVVICINFYTVNSLKHIFFASIAAKLVESDKLVAGDTGIKICLCFPSLALSMKIGSVDQKLPCPSGLAYVVATATPPFFQELFLQKNKSLQKNAKCTTAGELGFLGEKYVSIEKENDWIFHKSMGKYPTCGSKW